ncbi:MAG: hypothetical protein J7L58_04745 [Thermoplasmata archaeon]|nr:hypothetical protein [Thermoplasmata archaeon]
MFKKGWLKDRRGIEGLPMRLIIIVVVAVAVLAAIMAMIGMINPNKNLSISFREGTNFYSCGISHSDEYTVPDFVVKVTVTDADTGKPVKGATVTIYGYGGGGSSNPTDEKGETEITVKNVKIPANVDTIKLDLEVTAAHYNTLKVSDAITIVR